MQYIIRWGALVILGVGTVANADIVVAPQEIILNSVTDRAVINVTRDGSVLPMDLVDDVVVRVGDDVYRDVFDVRRSEAGIIELVPSSTIAPGIYDVTIRSGGEDATVRVIAPMRSTTVATTSTAEVQVAPPPPPTTTTTIVSDGSTVEVQTPAAPPVENANLNLQSLYYVGQTVVLDGQAPVGHTYRWSVNGDEITTGTGNSTLIYTFPEAGSYTITYTEAAPDGTVTTATGGTTAVTQPAINMTVGMNEPVALAAPAGFDTFEWMVDGVVRSTDAALTHAFLERGNHVITLRATRTSPGREIAFRVLTYNITVT